jgi:hypothetical protein
MSVVFDSHGNTVTQPDDLAYDLLMDDFTTTPIQGLYRSSCYICRDPEYAQMGLPLCYPCPKCNGHVPADDTVCTDCGFDNHPCE